MGPGLFLAAQLLMAPEGALPADEHRGPATGFSLGFAFEPRLGSYRALDDRLRGYGFGPVRSPVFLTYGLRGRVWTGRGWVFGGAMSYGFARRDAGENPVPTTMTRIETMALAGHQLGAGFDATVDVGFSVHSMSVGSTDQGGALVYMGPALQPRLGWVPPIRGSFLRLAVGYSVMFPVNQPHDQVLWEEGFRQMPIHAFLFGIESGIQLYRRQWRWRDR